MGNLIGQFLSVVLTNVVSVLAKELPEDDPAKAPSKLDGENREQGPEPGQRPEPAQPPAASTQSPPEDEVAGWFQEALSRNGKARPKEDPWD